MISACQPLLLVAAVLVLQGAVITSAFSFTQQSSARKNVRISSSWLQHPQKQPTTTATALSMSKVAKSGGRLISTEEQFNQEVLLAGTTSSSSTTTDDNTNNTAEPPQQQLPILVLFSAPWCGPCRLTNPIVKEILTQYKGTIDVIEISTDDFPEVAERAGVLSIPTIQLYYGGKAVETIVGCVSKNVLGRVVDKVLEDLGLLEDEEI